MLRENLLKKKILEGKVPLGFGLQQSVDPTMIGVVADAGADFVFIDMEHFPLTTEIAARAVASAHAAGITPLIRIPDVGRGTITQLIDHGAQTLFASTVHYVEELKELIEYARYSPEGSRGMFMMNSPAVNFTSVTDVASATAFQNQNMFLGANIETIDALDQLDEMLMPGLDWAIVGHQDLSQAYGVPGQYKHPLVLEAKDRVRRTCIERGIHYAAVAFSHDDFEEEVAAGASFVFYSGVVPFARTAVTNAVAAMSSVGASRVPVAG